LSPSVSRSVSLEAPNILVVTLCSTRADRADPSYARQLTPNLSQLASQGVSFSRAYTNATTTLPAHASLLTGLLPDRHGVIDFETRLSQALPSLPGVLGLYGYRSAWVMESNLPTAGQGSAGNVAPAGLGQAQGFLDAFDDQLYLRGDGSGFDVLEAWMEADQKPFFALALLRGAHLPYGDGRPYVETLDERVQEWLSPPLVQRPSTPAGGPPVGDAEVQRMNAFLDLVSTDNDVKASLDAAYDSGVASVDRALGRIMQALEASGQRDNTIVVVMGDHGEALGDSGVIGHSNNLHDAVLRVPLVWSDPESSRSSAESMVDVSTVDLMPTLLTRVGATVPVGIDGRDIAEVLDGRDTVQAHPTRSQAAALPGTLQRRAVAPGTGLDEVINSGNLRVLLSSDQTVLAQRRVGDDLVEVPSESAAVEALIEWKRSANLGRKKGQAERIRLSEAAIQQLQAEGYW